MPRASHHKLRLTRRAIEELQPQARRYRVLDSEIAGLSIMVMPSGRKTWSVRYTPEGGSPTEVVLGDYPGVLPELARDHAGKVRSGARLEGRDLAKERKEARRQNTIRKERTVERILDTYLDDARRRMREGTVIRLESTIRTHVKPKFGDKSLALITLDQVRKHVEGIEAEGLPGAARSTCSALKAIMAFALERGLIDVNPLQGYAGPAIRSRERVATHEELRLVWLGLEDMAKNPVGRSTALALQLAMLTLQRRSEVAGLTKAEVDFDVRRWTIPGSRTKNKSPQVVPLAPLAFKTLKAGFEHSGADVAFCRRNRLMASRATALTRGFIRLREDVGAGDLTVHDLRRTGATMMAEIGVSGDVISRILNHTPPGPQVTKIYNRFDYEPQKREALERWEAHLMSIVRKRPGKQRVKREPGEAR